jgi:hypothetical protein
MKTVENPRRWLPQDSKWRRGPPTVGRTSPALLAVAQAAPPVTMRACDDPARAVATKRMSDCEWRRETEAAPREGCTAHGARRASPQCAEAPQGEATSVEAPQGGVRCVEAGHAPLALTISCKALGQCLSLISDESERLEFLRALSGQARVEALRK